MYIRDLARRVKSDTVLVLLLSATGGGPWLLCLCALFFFCKSQQSAKLQVTYKVIVYTGTIAKATTCGREQ
jgi:hypothetical protein